MDRYSTTVIFERSDPEILHEDHSQESRHRILAEREGTLLFIIFEGCVLRPTPRQVVKRLDQLLAEAPTTGLILDLRPCTFLCSSAIGTLIQFNEESLRTQVPVIMLQPQPRVRSVLELLGIHNLFTFAEDADGARQALAS